MENEMRYKVTWVDRENRTVLGSMKSSITNVTYASLKDKVAQDFNLTKNIEITGVCTTNWIIVLSIHKILCILQNKTKKEKRSSKQTKKGTGNFKVHYDSSTAILISDKWWYIRLGFTCRGLVNPR